MKMKSTLALITVVSALFAGCASLGSLTPPITRELPAAIAAGGYEKAFAGALRAVGESGTIISSSKADGYISGRTNASINLNLQIAKDGSIRVTGALPSDKFTVGTTVEKEVDKFVGTLTRYVR